MNTRIDLTRPITSRLGRITGPMLSTDPSLNQHGVLALQRFDREHAATVASWVDSDATRRWVSPSVLGAVTPETVNRWVKPGGEAFVLADDGSVPPVAYGELNPMRAERRHFWLGHLIVDPALRGRGIGRCLTMELLRHAFMEKLAKRVSLIVFPDNRAAVQCYVKIGFRLIGEEFHRFGAASRAVRLLRFTMDHARFTSSRSSGESCAAVG